MSEEDLAQIYQDVDSAISESLPEVKIEHGDPEGDPPKEEIAPDIKEEAPQVGPEEQKARDKGWRPKEDWEGDPEGWITAGEFNRRTELFDKIGSQSKTIKDMQKKMDALVNHNKNLETRTREKVLAELQAERKEAVKVGDTERFDEVEKQIDEVKKQESAFEERPEPQAPEIPQPIKEFASRNDSWFEKDKEMTDFMVFKMQQGVNSGLSMKQALTAAEKSVRDTYSSKFENPKKNDPPSVMGGSREKRPSKLSMSNLTPEQKNVWHSLKGAMTEKEFLEQLEQVG